MAKVFVETRQPDLIIGTLNNIAKKCHGEFFGTSPNDGRLLFGFAKKRQAKLYCNLKSKPA